VYTETSPSGEGTFTFAVRAVGSDRRSGPPIMRSFVLDMIAPIVTISGSPGSGTTTRSTSTSFVLAFVPAEPPDSTIECSRTGTGGIFATSSCANQTGLAQGTHRFAARGRDAAGNVGAAAEVTWTIDTAAPVVVLGGTPADGTVTRTTSTSLTWSFVGNVPGGTLECRLAGPGTSESFSAPNCRNRTQLADGRWTFALQGRDAAGNVSEAVSISWTVDTTGPSVAWGGDSTPADGAVTMNGAVHFTWGFVDAAEAAAGHLELSLDGTTFSSATGTYTATITAAGAFNFYARGVDGVGNPGPVLHRSFTLTVPGPTVSIGGSPAEGARTNVATNLTFSAIGAQRYECSRDGAGYATCTSPQSYAYATGGSQDGAKTFAVRAFDAAGNVGDSATRTFVWDTVGPTVVVTGAPPENALVNRFNVTFTAEAGSTFQCRFNSGAWVACNDGQAFESGQIDADRTFEVQAFDVLGNPGPISLFHYHLDTISPDTFLDSTPPFMNVGNNATFVFHSNDPNAQFRCWLDDPTFSHPSFPCASPVVFSNMTFGMHTFSVQSFDLAGNNDSTFPGKSWTNLMP
jgi:hypothetical protein